jgi:hypothetical protein
MGGAQEIDPEWVLYCFALHSYCTLLFRSLIHIRFLQRLVWCILWWRWRTTKAKRSATWSRSSNARATDI